jgi:predicted transcriptional regulator
MNKQKLLEYLKREAPRKIITKLYDSPKTLKELSITSDLNKLIALDVLIKYGLVYSEKVKEEKYFHLDREKYLEIIEV